MHKKISSLLMAATMALTAITPAFASEIEVTEAGGIGNSKVTFEVVDAGGPEDPTIFSVYVPAVLPIKMDLDGNITVPTNAVIHNGVENKAIQVENAVVTTTGDWEHTNKEGAEAGSTDSHLLSLSMNGQDLKTATFPWRIEAAGSLDLSMEAVIPQQSNPSANEQIATVAFSLDWARNKEDLNATNELDKAKMDAVLKNLTGKLTFTTTAYTGEGGIDISKNNDGSVLAVMNGQDATVYSKDGVLGISTENFVGMFEEYKASTMDLRGLDTSEMTDMYEMFYDCTNLSSLDISSFDTSSVIDMRYMFANSLGHSGSLREINLNNFDTSSVTNMRYMFGNCTSLLNLDLSSFDTSAVTNTELMFYNCIALSNLDLSSFNTRSITSMEQMFRDCTSLSNLDLSSFDASSVTSVAIMFSGCTSLTTCYGRTQSDCDKFNSSSYKPANVNFVVKPKN